MLEELVREYKCLKEEAEFATRFANILESLTYSLDKGNKRDTDYYSKRSKELLEEYYRREV